MSVVLEGIQRQLDFSVSTHLCQAPNGTVSAVYLFFAPILHVHVYVVRPSSVWSSSFVLSHHYSEHYCLKIPVVTHSGDMSKQDHFPPDCFLQDRLFPVHSTQYCILLFSVSISHSK